MRNLNEKVKPDYMMGRSNNDKRNIEQAFARQEQIYAEIDKLESKKNVISPEEYNTLAAKLRKEAEELNKYLIETRKIDEVFPKIEGGDMEELESEAEQLNIDVQREKDEVIN